MICYVGNDLSPIKKIFGDIPLRVTVTHLHPFAGRFTPHLRERLWILTDFEILRISHLIDCVIVHSPGGLVWNQEIYQSFSWKSSPWFKIDAYIQNSNLSSKLSPIFFIAQVPLILFVAAEIIWIILDFKFPRSNARILDQVKIIVWGRASVSRICNLSVSLIL